MKHWWKILGALLVLYALIAGLLIPLKTGIEYIAPDSAETGDYINIEIHGYNAHYQDAKELRAWLKLDSVHYLSAAILQPVSQNKLIADFQIPLILPDDKESGEMTLVLSNEIDGYSLLPDALYVGQVEVDSSEMEEALASNDLWLASLTGIHDVEGLSFPYRNILYETIRNLFYHVPLWFGMIIILFISMIYSIIYLILGNTKNDHIALSLIQVGILYGILGLLTGAIWANWTWGEPWSGDVKQNMSAVALLIYLALLVLRYAFDDYEKQARYSAVYNIFAFIALIPLLFVIPRLYDSLHPGNGGNPGFGGEDLDSTMKMVFYPAIIGFTLLGFWMAQLARRFMSLKQQWLEGDDA